jgi:hypothetical protein
MNCIQLYYYSSKLTPTHFEIILFEKIIDEFGKICIFKIKIVPEMKALVGLKKILYKMSQKGSNFFKNKTIP